MLNLFYYSKRSLHDQLILFGSGLPCLLLFPFSIYRFFIGDYGIGIIDFLISLGLVMIFLQSWYCLKVRYLNTLAVISFMIGILWIIHTKGLSMIFWAFPALFYSFFVLKSREALLVNILFLSGITLMFFDVLTSSQALSIYPSLILACFFGFVFSICAERQNVKLLKLESKDALTQVKNKRSFDEKMSEVVSDFRRSPTSVSLLLIDVGCYKKVNDSHGNKKGDQVLIDFASRVNALIRASDHVYRFGGEEFVILTKHSSLDDAGRLAESIRQYINGSPSLSQYNVTVSIGVSGIIESDDEDSWFRRAEKALEESKKSGKSRVQLARVDEKKKSYFEAVQRYKSKSLLSRFNYSLEPLIFEDVDSKDTFRR